MSDKAHNETDKILVELEAHLAGIYDEAGAEVETKAAEYFKRFEAADDKKAAAVKAGKLSEDEYLRWRKNKLLYGEHWKRLVSVIASEYAAVNSTALAYINGKLPAIYALNYNHIGKDIKKQAESIGGYSFELVNADVIKNLATKDKTLLPYKYLDGQKDVRWNTKKVNSAVLQGILQGDSIPKMAKRLQSVTEMNKVSAIRNARTSVTSAECKARQDGFERAAKNGIEQEREWIATNDYRTRHVHRLLDGQTVGVNEPFRSELGNIMYPGDRSAHPSNVYNCRCTVISHVKSIKGVQVEAGGDYADRLTAQDLYEKDPKEFDIRQKKIRNESSDRALLKKYQAEFGKNAPRSLAKFQEMKYNDPKEWERYKTDLSSIRSGELSALADFELYKNTSMQIDEKLVGIITSNGIKITGKSHHFIARVIGSVQQRRSGVAIEDIFDALTNKTATIPPIKTSSNNNRSQKFRLNKVEVSVNPDTGILIQTNPCKLKGER